MSSGLTVRFTKGDLLSGKLMDSGWKIAEVISFVEGISKSGKDGYDVDFRILAPNKYEGVEVRCWYYDKMGMAALSRMFERILGSEVKDGQDYNASATIGKKLKIYTEVKTNPNSGQPGNNVMDYGNINDTNKQVPA